MKLSSVGKHASGGVAADRPEVPEPSFAERARTLMHLGRIGSTWIFEHSCSGPGGRWFKSSLPDQLYRILGLKSQTSVLVWGTHVVWATRPNEIVRSFMSEERELQLGLPPDQPLDLGGEPGDGVGGGGGEPPPYLGLR